MCGLVGLAGPLNLKDEMVFKALVLIDYFRGTDSTGIASVTRTGRADILKVADDPIILFQHSEFDTTVNGNCDVIWMGHNRASTVGASTRANAHPFWCNQIIGAHNGTLTSASIRALAEGNGEVYGTDSEAIFWHIAKFGIEATVPILEGAWALTWYDTDKETFNYLRNSERPLWTVTTERDGKKTLLWASEWGFIAAARNVAQATDTLCQDEEGYAYFPVPENTWHRYNLSDIVKGVIEPETEHLVGKPTPPKPTAITNNTSKTGGNGSNSSGTSSNSSTTYEVVLDNRTEIEMDLDDSLDDLFNGALAREEWDMISSYGCSYCGTTVTEDMDGLAVFLNEGVVLCPTCADSGKTAVYNSMASSSCNVIH